MNNTLDIELEKFHKTLKGTLVVNKGLKGILHASHPDVKLLKQAHQITGTVRHSTSIQGMESTGTIQKAPSIKKTLQINKKNIGILNPATQISGNAIIPFTHEIEHYYGISDVVPMPYQKQILNTRGKLLDNNITVEAIPYYQTSNMYGDTVYIGG